MLQPPADIDQRHDGVAQAQEIAAEHVEALDVGAGQRLAAGRVSSISSTSAWIVSITGM